MTATSSDIGLVEAKVSIVDWRAIIAGAVGAAALFGLFLAFGSALGLSMTSARPYAGLSATVIGVILAIWFAAVHVGSFAAGGYLAGRLRSRSDGRQSEREFRDGAHGFLVWALGAIVSAFLLASGVASVVRGTAEVGASAVSGVASAAGTAASGVASNPKGAAGLAENVFGYTADTMLRAPNTAPGATPTPPATPGGAAASTGQAAEIGRILIASAASGEILAADRQYLAQLVASRTGLSQADAEKRVDETWARFRALRVEAETKARDAAEVARKTGVITGFLAAAISLAGLAAAVWGAGLGATHRNLDTSPRLLGRDRFW